MKNIIGILREGLSKKGEKRVAITAENAKHILGWGHKLIVQSAINPKTGEIKRIFPDIAYKRVGAIIDEDLSPANVIFGLKEMHISRILPNKVYLLFSHTHKGQLKNRKLLQAFVKNYSTVIDYELIRNDENNRLITAFTYNAGYAGMVNTLWVLGKRLKIKGIHNPFESVLQSIEEEHLYKAREHFLHVANKIESRGTPRKLPPIIVCFLGKGRTAKGALEMFNILPYENILIEQLKEVYENGSRKKLHVLHIQRDKIYRLKEKSLHLGGKYNLLSDREKRNFYNENPQHFESNLENILPYITVLMSCIIWSQEYPRTVTKEMMKNIYKKNKTLQVIGDITCDPNGSIEFSKETWIDNPVYIYNPTTGKIKDGFEGEGVAVMAVTNLPSEFSADASEEFSNDLFPFLKNIVSANYGHTLDQSKLSPEIQRAVIMWKGEFTEEYKYLRKFICE